MGKIGWQERENVKRRETDMFLFFIIPTYANGNPAFQPEFVRFRAEFVLVRLDLSDPVATFAQTWCHMLLGGLTIRSEFVRIPRIRCWKSGDEAGVCPKVSLRVLRHQLQ
jgi:hypothetical protein